MRSEILKMLRQSGDYLSGQQLCQRLGVSRTAIWKAIRQLEEEGYLIEAVRNKGYRLVEEPDVITASQLGSQLSGSWIVSRLMKQIPPTVRPEGWQRQVRPMEPW